MTLGRTSSGAIKIKTDTAGGGLRAVSCACCNNTEFDACCHCPGVFGDWNFSATGGPIPFTYGGNYETVISDCEDGGGERVCVDFFDAFGFVVSEPSGDMTYSEATASVTRSGTNLTNCGWTISLQAGFEIFDTVTLNGPDGETEVVDDWPFYSMYGPDETPEIFIAGNSPTGTFSLITQSYPSTGYIPEGWTIQAPSHSYEYTFSIT